MSFPKHSTSLKGFAKGSPKSQLAVFCRWKLTNCCGIIESTNVDRGSGSHPQLVGLRMAKASHPASPFPGGDAMQDAAILEASLYLSDLSYHIVYMNKYIYIYTQTGTFADPTVRCFKAFFDLCTFVRFFFGVSRRFFFLHLRIKPIQGLHYMFGHV